MRVHFGVALFVSAWIEINIKHSIAKTNPVALFVSAWIEIRLLNHNRYGQRGRTPCECVDWNNKYDAMYYNDLSRTPCECVDWNMCVLQRKQKD